MIRALIVDDEALAREGVRVFLEKETDIEVVGEAADGPSALSAIRELEPNLLFLDVEMPGFNAFEVLEQMAGGGSAPAVVFVTAYDRYAVQAFEAHAVDYLLKPISSDRFQEALQRVRMDFAKDEELDRTRQRVLELLRAKGAGGDHAHDRREAGLERLVVRDRDSFLLLKVGELDWVESAGNYVELHARGRSFLLRTTMSELETQLDAARFARIHRSTIVNVDRVREIKPSWHGDFNVILADGVTLRMSRGYRNRLLPD